jgi:hypothetical protein
MRWRQTVCGRADAAHVSPLSPEISIMILNLKLPASLAVVAALAVAAPWNTGTAHAYACKSSPHQAVAVHNVRTIARSNARKNWTASAKTQYGLAWSVWSIAKDRSVNCAKLSSGQWRCLASAKPCQYVVP